MEAHALAPETQTFQTSQAVTNWSDNPTINISSKNESMVEDIDDVAAIHLPDSLSVIVESSTLTVIMVVAILANLFAIATILRVPILRRNPHNLLILNLTVTDLAIAVITMVFSLVSVFDNGRFLRTHPALCNFNGFCTVVLSASSFATITCISIDRYLSVVWSTRFPPNHRRACTMVISIWLFSSTYAAVPLFRFHSSYAYLSDTHHCSPVWDMCFFYVVGFSINYVITIPIMFTCYVFVFRIIWRKQHQLKVHRSGAKNCSAGLSEQSMEDTPVITDSRVTHSISDAGNTFFSGSISTMASPPPSAAPGKQTAPKARLSISLSMSHLDKIGSSGSPPGGMMDASGCTGICQLQGITDCPHCSRDVWRRVGGCSTLKGRSDRALDNDFLNSSYCSRSIQSRSNNMFEMTQRSLRMKERRNNVSLSMKPSRSQSFFSLTNPRPRNSATTGNKLSCNGTFDKARTLRLSKRKKRQRHTLKRMKKLRADKQVALTGTFLITSSIVCWLPYAIIRSCFFPVSTPHWAGISAMWLSFVNTLLDPLIYAFMNRRVKQKVRDDFRSLKQCLNNSSCGFCS